MIRLYHKERRNERTALDKAAYMVDGDGFIELPETEDGARHALILRDCCDFVFVDSDVPEHMRTGLAPEPPSDAQAEPETPLVSADEVRSAVDAGERFEPITELELEETEPEPPNDPPTEEGDPDVPNPPSDVPSELPPEPPEPAEEPPELPEVTTELSRAELLAMAASMNLEGVGSMNKTELVEAINAARAG